MNILNEFEAWIQEKYKNFEVLGYQHEITKVFSENKIESLRFDLDSNSKIARISAWSSGEFQLEIIDVNSEETVFDKYLNLDKNINFNQTFEEFLSKLSNKANINS